MIPTPREVFGEFSRWEKRWKVPKGKQPDLVAKVLKVFDIESYPNIYALLKILRTVAVTSRECERSGIVLKRLDTHLWASIGQNRLSTSIDADKLGYWHWC